jgi:hypothetical protein
MPATTPGADTPRRPAFPALQWWFRDEHGKVVVAQAPNPPILVWLVSVVIGWIGVFDGERALVVARIGQGALIAWSLDELLRGASPARRLLGAVVLTAMLVRLLG